MPRTTTPKSGQDRPARKSANTKSRDAVALLTVAADNPSKVEFQFTDDERAWAVRILTAAREVSAEMRRVSMQGFANAMDILAEEHPWRPSLRLVIGGAK
ncbi:hypothetical protein [Duganella callida]|uniref:Uncharacterized protein n=1 Tax=Duganella callida TaxID=2561932 RepID=A0A4Y9S024_9BURK|nr:hypothetical protein [Duganella callida]TFW13279.1 hypothetical protein E4L98_29190 [Duganella callida]